MFLKSVLDKCKEEGYPITSTGLYYSGKKYGFLKKNNKSRRLDFDKDKFYTWLNKAKQEIPRGWVSINEMSKRLGISLSQAYILSKDKDSGAKCFGAGPGVLYVELERIKTIIEQRNESRKEKWS